MYYGGGDMVRGWYKHSCSSSQSSLVNASTLPEVGLTIAAANAGINQTKGESSTGSNGRVTKSVHPPFPFDVRLTGMGLDTRIIIADIDDDIMMYQVASCCL